MQQEGDPVTKLVSHHISRQFLIFGQKGVITAEATFLLWVVSYCWQKGVMRTRW